MYSMMKTGHCFAVAVYKTIKQKPFRLAQCLNDCDLIIINILTCYDR